jgi:DNA recombination protein RmuC
MSSNPLVPISIALQLVAVVLLLVLLVRGRSTGAEGLGSVARDELRAAREEQGAAARALREELTSTIRASTDAQTAQLAGLAEQLRKGMTTQVEETHRWATSAEQRLGAIREAVEQLIPRVEQARADYAASALQLRDELGLNLKNGNDAALRSLGEITAVQQKGAESNQAALERLRETMDMHLRTLQEGNERKLEEMRVTVDEKLHGTLEKRLGESFALVSERLEAVQRGLGEMQLLATGVGDLKRVLTNVKTRGVWGEYQLQAILEQILTPDQYVANYRPDSTSGEVVEFAIRLPGRDPSGDPVFLPIDSKFPQEDYHRLLEAADRADPAALQVATAGLVKSVHIEARTICDKYLRPPHTTDFAILFLPTEGLYAEVLRQPGLVQDIHSRCHIVIAGPTTLAAILSSLRMGFRTLAIEQRSSEVWKVLGAVKTEFGKFGETMEKLKKQLNTATNTIDDTARRTRVMAQRLKSVEELPLDLAGTVLGLNGDGAALLAVSDGAADEE